MKKAIQLTTLFCALAFILIIGSCTPKDIEVFYSMDEYQTCLPQNMVYATQVDSFTLTQDQIKAAFTAVNQNFDLTKIKAAKVSELKATIVTTGTTFNDIGGFSVYMKTAGTDGLGTQVAYINDMPDGATDVTMSINGTDLVSLLNSQQITVTITTTKKAVSTNAAVCFKLTGGKMDITLSGK